MKARYFLGIAVIAFVVGVSQVIVHQHHAGTLAAKVTTDDATGLDTTSDQQVLARYVATHMATSRTVLLSASYNRALQAAQAASNPTSNGTVYSAAQAACASHADSLVQARCVQAYLAAHSTSGTNPQVVTTPVKADYTKTFTAPNWTADSAGVPLLVAFTAMAMAAYLISLRRL
jgi:hypothetical protein